jgi:hypothetical protein
MDPKAGKNLENPNKKETLVKRDSSKGGDRTDGKTDGKSDKVDRPVKWAKNKHSFVVAGKYFSDKIFFY